MQSHTIQIIFFLLYVTLAVMYIRTLSKTLKAIQLKNRKIKPVLVWLMLIPVFNFFWNFILAKKIAYSIEAEILELGHNMNGKTMYSFGIFCSVMYLMTLLSKFITDAHLLISIPGLIIWLYYWKKVDQYRKALIKLKQEPQSSK